MQYISTRGKDLTVTASQVIVQGLAHDGGLYVPEFFPQIPYEKVEQMACMSYQSIAAELIGCYLTEFLEQELTDMTSAAYGEQFDTNEIAPLVQIDAKESVLELYHGPTLAFKDMALQLLPHLMRSSMEKNGIQQKVLILVATSGDTGKAALEGFRDVENVDIAVYYPKEGVSPAQKLQMLTQEGNNVYVFGVDGDFDDTQTGVKRIFSDPAMQEKLAQKGCRLSSANSMNWGRLVSQIVYYFYSYAQLRKHNRISSGEKVNFVVPSGNFGNILAGYYAKKMGLPIHKLICASNRNNVLTDFFQKGEYNRNRAFYQTSSPSMDILISSNLERLLFEITERDSEKVALWMQSLQQSGAYQITPGMQEIVQDSFYADWCNDKEVLDTIREVWMNFGYLMDTHTAVAQHVYEQYYARTQDPAKTVIVSTASPYKFASHVLQALQPETDISQDDEFNVVRKLSEATSTAIPRAIQELQGKPILHQVHCAPNEMEDTLLEQLKI